MKAEPRIDPSLTDVAVRAELFYLNLCDELGGRTDVSPDEMHLAFSRALDKTASDMPKDNPGLIEPSPADLPDFVVDTPSKPRTALIYTVATAAAVIVAMLVRCLAVYFLES